MAKLLDLSSTDGRSTRDVLKSIGPELAFSAKLRHSSVTVTRLLYVGGYANLDEWIGDATIPVWSQIELLSGGILVRLRASRSIYALAIPFPELTRINISDIDPGREHVTILANVDWLSRPSVLFNPGDVADWSSLNLMLDHEQHLRFRLQKRELKKARRFFGQEQFSAIVG